MLRTPDRLAWPRRIRAFLMALFMVMPVLVQADERVNPVIAAHEGDLVKLQGGTLSPFKSESFLKAPYTVLYFGAGWCPDCRHFSPALVAAYDHQPAEGKRFEVLLLSMDKSAEGLRKFMETEKMAWPAVSFEKMARAADLKRFYSGHGIPCLTVIDRQGTVVLQSKNDQDAAEVLKEIEALVKKMG
jgi:thiol-disulfide isomerase/thioredoxin